ncbi:MAG: hypothetical protein ACQEQV_09035 [Fibrobacterota bacterium]
MQIGQSDYSARLERFQSAVRSARQSSSAPAKEARSTVPRGRSFAGSTAGNMFERLYGGGKTSAPAKSVPLGKKVDMYA